MARNTTKAVPSREAQGRPARGRAAPRKGGGKRALQANLDLLLAALARRGHDLRRHEAIEVLAEALGHRSGHETSAAVAEGGLRPSTVTAVAAVALPDGGVASVGRDAEGRLVGVAPGLAGTTRYVPSPYGGLLDIAGLAELANGAATARVGAAEPAGDRPASLVRPMRDLEETRIRVGGDEVYSASGDGRAGAIARWCRGRAEGPLPQDDEACLATFLATHPDHVAETRTRRVPSELRVGQPGTTAVEWATVTHRHGVNCHIGATREDVDRELAAFAREYWDEALGLREGADADDEEEGRDPADMPDGEVVDAYFEMMASEEQLDRGTEVVWIGGVAAAAGTLTVHGMADGSGEEIEFHDLDEARAKSRLVAWCLANWESGSGWRDEPPDDADDVVAAFVDGGQRWTHTVRSYELG